MDYKGAPPVHGKKPCKDQAEPEEDDDDEDEEDAEDEEACCMHVICGYFDAGALNLRLV